MTVRRIDGFWWCLSIFQHFSDPSRAKVLWVLFTQQEENQSALWLRILPGVLWRFSSRWTKDSALSRTAGRHSNDSENRNQAVSKEWLSASVTRLQFVSGFSSFSSQLDWWLRLSSFLFKLLSWRWFFSLSNHQVAVFYLALAWFRNSWTILAQWPIFSPFPFFCFFFSLRNLWMYASSMHKISRSGIFSLFCLSVCFVLW